MSTEPRGERAARRRKTIRRRRVVAALSALAVVAVVTVVLVNAASWLTGNRPAPATAQTEAPPSPAETSAAPPADPDSCTVTFSAEGVSLPAAAQKKGALYQNLPIPERGGFVFAGWYPSAADASARTAAARVNGSDQVSCQTPTQTLYGAWLTKDQAAAEKTRVPILMYHQFTTKPEGENNSLTLNYAYIKDFEDHIRYISESGFYLPTWPELAAFIDGRLVLPQRSVIVTDDDADHTWFELAVPIVVKYKVMTTSFVITKWRSEPSPSSFVLQRSHTHDMHDPGADGRGRMVNWSADQVAADMETSAKILGAKEVMAYPFGHVNATAKEGLRKAGFEMARTIEQGYVTPGTDKLELPCIRVNYGMTLADLKEKIG